MALDEALLEILVCPIDKRGLLYFADEALLYNPRLRRSYRIENDIPVMLAHGATPVADDEHARLIARARSGAAVGTSVNHQNAAGITTHDGDSDGDGTTMPAVRPPMHSPSPVTGAPENVTLDTLPRSVR
jgi:uncharacterized protein YbaR (Trm112 family)